MANTRGKEHKREVRSREVRMCQEGDERLKEGESTCVRAGQRTNALTMEGVELGPNLGGQAGIRYSERCGSVILGRADLGNKDAE